MNLFGNKKFHKGLMEQFITSYEQYSLKEPIEKTSGQEADVSEEEYGKEMFRVYGEIFRQKQLGYPSKPSHDFRICRSELPVAAGDSNQLCDIDWNILKEYGVSEKCSIVSRETSTGYALRIEADIPFVFTLVFYNQADQELYRTVVHQEIPEVDDYIPFQSIQDWAYLRFIEQ